MHDAKKSTKLSHNCVLTDLKGAFAFHYHQFFTPLTLVEATNPGELLLLKERVLENLGIPPWTYTCQVFPFLSYFLNKLLQQWKCSSSLGRHVTSFGWWITSCCESGQYQEDFLFFINICATREAACVFVSGPSSPVRPSQTHIVRLTGFKCSTRTFSLVHFFSS